MDETVEGGPGGTLDDKLLACIHCGFCLPACPTYQVLGDEADSPRGRLHLMRAVAEGRLPASDQDYQLHLDRCLGCRACEPVCPAGVPYGELLEHAREEIAGTRPHSLATRALLAAFGEERWSGLVGGLGRVLRATGLPGFVARAVPRGPRLHPVRLGLAMLQASGRWAGLRREGRGRPGQGSSTRPEAITGRSPSGARVGVLAGCVQKGLFGRVGAATRRVLEANGYQVETVSSGGCCGALHAHAGELEAAREAARRQIQAFEEAGVEVVVADAAGCGAAMKGYAELLAADSVWAARARDFQERVRDVTELLAEAGPRTGGRIELRAAYDPPCHLLHGQGVHDPVLTVLAAVPGLEVLQVPGGEGCCGGAGIYGLTQGELGHTIAREKVQAVARTGARVVLTGNPGCMMQIGAGLLLEDVETGVAHPVEILDESYRRGGIYA